MFFNHYPLYHWHSIFPLDIALNHKSLQILLYFLIATASLCVAPNVAIAKDSLRSSVSPEFRGGLQEKFLGYIADEMELPLSIHPIIYANRVKLLRAGKIDIMVGVKDQHLEKEDFIFIKPSYEQLTNNVFVLKKNLANFTSLNDLNGTTIAFTPDNTTIIEDIEKLGINHMPAPFLDQKIKLLQKGRVDGFVYFKEAALAKIKALGLENEIVMANMSPFSVREHYVALSLKSPLIANKEQLTNVIKNGITRNKFKQLRQQHYAEKFAMTKQIK